MEATQLTLDMWQEPERLRALRAALDGSDLYDSDVEILLLAAREPQAEDGMTFVAKSRADWGRAIGVDGTTAARALRRLAARGVAALEVTEGFHAVLIDWAAVAKLPRRGDLERQLRQARREIGVGSVRPWVGPTTCIQEHKTTRVPCERVTVDTVSRGLIALPPRPWARQNGLPPGDLCAAVAQRDRRILTGLYFAGVEARYWDNTPQRRHLFLAFVHHAVAAEPKNAMALLTKLLKGGLPHPTGGVRPPWDASALTNEDDDWASAARAEWNRAGDPVLVEAAAARLERSRSEREIFGGYLEDQR